MMYVCIHTYIIHCPICMQQKISVNACERLGNTETKQLSFDNKKRHCPFFHTSNPASRRLGEAAVEVEADEEVLQAHAGAEQRLHGPRC